MDVTGPINRVRDPFLGLSDFSEYKIHTQTNCGSIYCSIPLPVLPKLDLSCSRVQTPGGKLFETNRASRDGNVGGSEAQTHKAITAAYPRLPFRIFLKLPFAISFTTSFTIPLTTRSPIPSSTLSP